MSSIGNWLMAIVTLGLYSILVNDNRLFRIVEHLYVGVTAGNAIVVTWVYIRDSGLQPIAKGNWLILIPVILGLLQFTRFSKSYSWVSRYPVQWLVGVGIGVSLVTTLNVHFIGQVTATMRPLTSLNAIIIFIGTLATVLYFHFSAKQTQLCGASARLVGS